MNDVRLRFVDLRRNLSRFLLQTTTMLFMIVTLSLANSSLSAENESADDANDESRPRVFLLSVADYRSYESSALRGVKRDVRTVKTFFRRHVPAQLFEYMQVNPKAATRKAVLDAINKLKAKKIGKNDVVVFYYTGSGAYDVDKGSYFALKNAKGEVKPLYRSEVKSRLGDLGARLVVVLTDCSNDVRSIETFGVPKKIASRRRNYDFTEKAPVEVDVPKKTVKGYSPVMKSLFVNVKTRGFVDLTSSVRGERSYAYEDGSLATTVAIKTFEQLNGELKENQSFKVDWRRFVKDWIEETEAVSKERRKSEVDRDPTVQEKQTPYVYELPDSHRLGAWVLTTMCDKGVRINAITPNSPAEKIGLKVDDVIRQIGDKETDTEEDYNKILNLAPRKTTITFGRHVNDKSYAVVKKVDVVLDETKSDPTSDPDPTSDSDPTSDPDPMPDPDPTSDSDPTPDQISEEHKPFVGLTFEEGNKIAGVAPNSPAEEAGLQVGYIVGSFDSQEIYDSKDFEAAVASAGDEAVLGVRTNDGQKLKVRVIGIRTKPRADSNKPADSNNDVPAFSGSTFSDEGETSENGEAKCWMWRCRPTDYYYPTYYNYSWYCPCYYVSFRLVTYTLPIRYVVTTVSPAGAAVNRTVTSTTTSTTQSSNIAYTNYKSSGAVSKGAVVDGTIPAQSPLKKMGLRSGDIIVKIDGKKVDSLADVKRATSNSKIVYIRGNQIKISGKYILQKTSNNVSVERLEGAKADAGKTLYEYYDENEKLFEFK